MCGRYLVITEEEIIEIKSILEELNQRFSDIGDFPLKSAGTSDAEVIPSLLTPVLVSSEDRFFLKPMKWGFSRWDKNGSIINARAESVEEKPFFRDAFLHGRCVIPSRGFFEWKKPSPDPLSDLAASSPSSSPSGKYWIRRADSPLFLMAGIYQKHQGADEFVILTMPANIQIAPVHDRMPVYLEKPQLLPWLKDACVLQALLQNRVSSVPFLLSQASSGKRKLR